MKYYAHFICFIIKNSSARFSSSKTCNLVIVVYCFFLFSYSFHFFCLLFCFLLYILFCFVLFFVFFSQNFFSGFVLFVTVFYFLVQKMNKAMVILFYCVFCRLLIYIYFQMPSPWANIGKAFRLDMLTSKYVQIRYVDI